MATAIPFRTLFFVTVVLVVATIAGTKAQEDQRVGKCYSSNDCGGGSYSAAGGRWTKRDCCSLGNHPCWCDENNVCQPSCGSASIQSKSSPLGKCYSSKDCSGGSYSTAGGKWTKEDCCSIGNRCWCDEANVCRPSCGSSTHGTSSPLGKCYSSKYCQNSYSRAGGMWTKSDCCSIGNRCWCDQGGVCQPSCLTTDSTRSSVLGKCYSTRDCSESYSMATGKWTKQDCCLVDSGSCWCDTTNGRCRSSCSSTNQQAVTPLILGKCYSTSTCESYSAAGGLWTKDDCCSLGHQCWCDQQKRCHPSCTDSNDQSAIYGKCYSSSDCKSYSAVGGKWSKEDCCLSGNPCWCDSKGNCHLSCSSVPSDASSHPKISTKPPGVLHSDTESPGTTEWNPPSNGVLHSDAWSTQTAKPPARSSGKHMVYLWCLMTLVVVWPLVVILIYCISCHCRKCGSTTVNNINYVQINTDSKAV